MAKLSGWAFPVEPDEATGRIKMVEDNDCVRQDIRLIIRDIPPLPADPA